MATSAHHLRASEPLMVTTSFTLPGVLVADLKRKLLSD
jgi:hypothetical protein